MSAPNTFVFFSTHRVDLKNSSGLLQADHCEVIVEQDKRKVWQLKKYAIFARQAIDEDKLKALLQQDHLEKDILDFFETAWQNYLKSSDAHKIEQVRLFIHARELSENSSVELLRKESNHKKFYESLQEITNLAEDQIRVYAFKHEDNFVNDILEVAPEEFYSLLHKRENEYAELLAEKKWASIDFEQLYQALEKGQKEDSKLAYYFEEKNRPFDKMQHFPKTLSEEKDAFLKLFFISRESLTQRKNFDQLIDKAVSGFFPDKDTAPNAKPILFIGSADLFGQGDMGAAPLDDRYHVLDSSIWMRYLPIQIDDEPKGGFINRLKALINTMEGYHRQGLYKSVVALEYLEFNIRQFRNAYLTEFSGGGHASSVTPFSFHSESKMQVRSSKTSKTISTKELIWDVLLIDDFAKKPLRSIHSGAEETDTANKASIIDSLINSGEEGTSRVVNLKLVTTLDAAQEAFVDISKAESFERQVTTNDKPSNKDKTSEDTKSKTELSILPEVLEQEKPPVFDIVLLDYLFSQDAEHPVYGSSLLEAIDNNQITQGKAINNKYWIFPVTVFPEALASTLQKQSIQYQEKHWVLARGADPINTPELFRAALLEFMCLQFDGIEVTIEQIIELWLQHRLIDIKDRPIDARRWARSIFPAITNKFGKLDTIYYDSAFARVTQSYQPGISEKAVSVNKAENVLNLWRSIIYNLAFSTLFDHSATITSYQKLYEMLKVDIEKLNTDDQWAMNQQLKHLGEGIYGIHNKY